MHFNIILHLNPDLQSSFLSSARFGVLISANMKTIVFWVVTPCSLVESYQCFGGIPRQQVPPKRLKLSNWLYDLRLQKTAILLAGLPTNKHTYTYTYTQACTWFLYNCKRQLHWTVWVPLVLCLYSGMNNAWNSSRHSEFASKRTLPVMQSFQPCPQTTPDKNSRRKKYASYKHDIKTLHTRHNHRRFSPYGRPSPIFPIQIVLFIFLPIHTHPLWCNPFEP